MEKPAASARRAANGFTNGSREPFVPEQKGRTRDIAAEAVGMSGPSFARMKTIVTVAANEDEPEEVREVARAAAEAIAATLIHLRHMSHLSRSRSVSLARSRTKRLPNPRFSP